MSEIAFVSFIPDHYGVGSSKFVVCSEQRQTKRATLDELVELEIAIVVHDGTEFVDECRRAGIRCPAIIDLRSVLKIAHGISRDQGGEALWDPWRALAQSCNRPHDIYELSRISQGRQAAGSEDEAYRILELGSVALADVWMQLQARLRDAGEFDRFWNVEVPIQRIFYQRQRAGVAIDADCLKGLINSANEEKYASYLKVARALNRSPSGIQYRNVGGMLRGTDAEFLSEFSQQSNFEEYFKLASESSAFARDFVSYMRSSRDVNTLVQLTSENNRVFPTFLTSGTVSSRILMRDPFIQELRKRYRGAICADDGFKLAYLDYGQFEPGILASMAEDNELIEMYNSSDLYNSLALSVFKSEDQRSLAKKMFLGFCYGMSKENIAKLVCGASASAEDRTTIERKVGDFFEKFSALPKLRDRQQSELFKLGRVTSMLGNRRVRTDTGDLTPRERRWALSQAIQGTASLIFKEALIGIDDLFGWDAIVLPMHDAVLLQFRDDAEYEEKRECAANIMRQSLTNRCPKLSPKVVISEFAAPN